MAVLPPHALRAFVESEIANYRPVVSPGSYGSPLPASFFTEGLERLKHSLVEPYLLRVRVEEFERPGNVGDHIDVWVFAEDGDHRVAYSEEVRDFVALERSDGEWRTLLWGDPVGCYLAI